jgi:hypothetical protein
VRPGLRIDRAHEEADRTAGRQIACPMLLLAATHDDLDIHGDPEAIWRPWVAGKLRSAPIQSGHHQAEQAPDELAQGATRIPRRSDSVAERSLSMREHKQANAQRGRTSLLL